MKTQPKFVPITATQRNFIMNRLQQARMKAWRSDSADAVKPATITKAEAEIERLQAIVDKWRKTQRDARNKLDAQALNEIREIEEKLLFSGAEEALAVLKKFEAKWGVK